MTTNKPEVVAWYTPTTRGTLPVVALNDRSQRGEPLIRLSDYEALQAECKRLQAAHEEEIFRVRQDRDTHFGEMMRALEQVDAMKAECEQLRKSLEDAEARGAALSAGACHGGYGDDYGNHRCHYQNRIDHLLALLRHSYPIIKAHAGASHMLEGFRPKRNQWDELVEGIDAAMEGGDQ